MKLFKILSAVLFFMALVFYICADAKIKAEDDTLPVLTDTLQGNLAVSINDAETSWLSGLVAEDEKDGDLTDEICIAGVSPLLSDDRRRVQCVVFDRDRHAATLTRTIQYTDYTPPRFILSKEAVYSTGELSALLSEISAKDGIDGDISDRIRFYTEEIQFLDEDLYTLPVFVTNSYGGESRMTLYVQQSDSAAQIHLTEGIVYWTQGEKFDPKAYFAGVFDRAGKAVKIKKQEITEAVDVQKPGCYPVRYTVETEAETVRACLTVIVEEGAA